jgi:hypothetical protein
MTSVIVVGKTVKEMRSSGWKDKDIQGISYQSREGGHDTYSSVDTKDIDCVT